MRPSEVRKLILEDHAWLREMLEELDELARRLLDGKQGIAGRLRERALAFQARFLQHLELEETHLVPALRRADAWGPERAARVLEEHEAQREELADLLHALRDPERSAREIAVGLRRVVKDLLLDMDHEERAILDPRILRDDPVAVDVETG